MIFAESLLNFDENNDSKLVSDEITRLNIFPNFFTINGFISRRHDLR